MQRWKSPSISVSFGHFYFCSALLPRKYTMLATIWLPATAISYLDGVSHAWVIPPFLVGFWRRRVEQIFYLEKDETQLSRMLRAVRLRHGRAYPDQCQRLVSKQAAPALALLGPAGR
jgi:hypothetical protein